MARKKTNKAKRARDTQDTAKAKTVNVKAQAQVSKHGSDQAEAGSLPLIDNIRSWVGEAKSFLKEVRVEFDKVNWPSKKETIAMTTAVMAITFFFTFFLGIVDVSLSELVSFLIY